jgi:hypothetical protein
MNLAYWIGMTFTAFAADQVLSVPRTIHALQGGHRITRANPMSRSLADLIGQDAALNWHVFEAKGRQRVPTAPDRAAWKAQARTIATVNGVAVATTSYCVGLLTNPCRIDMVDPPPRRRQPIDLTLSPNMFRLEYYRPYIEFLRTGASTLNRQGRLFRVRPIAFDPIEGDYI